MKSILYVGATLMIGASIYGFVDFKKTNRNREFQSMYQEKTPARDARDTQESAPAVPEITVADIDELKKPTKISTAKDSEKSPRKKSAKANKKVNYKQFSRSAMVKEDIEEVITKEK